MNSKLVLWHLHPLAVFILVVSEFCLKHFVSMYDPSLSCLLVSLWSAITGLFQYVSLLSISVIFFFFNSSPLLILIYTRAIFAIILYNIKANLHEEKSESDDKGKKNIYIYILYTSVYTEHFKWNTLITVWSEWQ